MSRCDEIDRLRGVKQQFAAPVVQRCMMAMHPANNFDAQSARIHVEVPRAADAVGGALRGAYARDRSLPSDMRLLLEQLDAKTAKRG